VRERCHQADPLFQEVKLSSLVCSLNSFTFHLREEKPKQQGPLAMNAPGKTP